MNVND